MKIVLLGFVVFLGACSTYTNLPLKVTGKHQRTDGNGTAICQLRLSNSYSGDDVYTWSSKAEYCDYEIGQEIK